jgi:hypothetical protein
MIPTDALWSPLFASAEVAELSPPGAEQQVQLCWKKRATIELPLLLVAPYRGTAVVVTPAGCRTGTLSSAEGFTALSLDATDLSLVARVHMGSRETLSVRWPLPEEDGVPPPAGTSPPPPVLRLTREHLEYNDVRIPLGVAPVEKTAGVATLLVDGYTTDVEVDGRSVFHRDWRPPASYVDPGKAAPTPVKVTLPADGRAVHLNTTHQSFSAQDGGFWHEGLDTGYTILLPDHEYRIKLGKINRVAPPGTTCYDAEGGPPGAVVRTAFGESIYENTIIAEVKSNQLAVLPRYSAVGLRITESGRYRAHFGPLNTVRVTLDPAGCAAPAAP